MAAKINWHRRGTRLRHCHPVYILPDYLVNINVRKQAINDKLQGSVATCLKYGGVFNNQIKKGLLMSLSVKNNQIR